MNTPLLRLSVGAAVVFTAAGLAVPARSAPSDLPKFPTPTGRISYKMAGGSISGTSSLIWADSGKKFRSDANLTMGAPGARAGAAKPGGAAMAGAPMSGTLKQWTIADGKFLYVHLPMQGQVVSRIPQTPERLKQATSGAAVPLAGGDKGKVIGKGTVLGKPCEIRESGNFKMWMWKGLPLKMEMMNQGMNLTIIATKVEAPAKVAATAFKVPSGYQIVDQKPGTPAAGVRRPSVPK